MSFNEVNSPQVENSQGLRAPNYDEGLRALSNNEPDEESPSAWVTTEIEDEVLEDEVFVNEEVQAHVNVNTQANDGDFGEPVFMGAMVEVSQINEDELILNNEAELAAVVEETFEEYCKRTKKKKSKKLKVKWQKDQQNAKEQLEKNVQLREKRRATRQAQDKNTRKRKLKEARELRSLKVEIESKNAKKKRLENDKISKAKIRDNESEEQREARLESQRVIQSQLRENESNAQREARLEVDRSQHADARNNENEGQREERLEDLRNAYRERRETLPREFHAADSNNAEEFSLGPMNNQCQGCKAMHFSCETKMNKGHVKGAYDSCCNGGKIKVSVSPYPRELERLMRRQEGTEWKEFSDNILKFNTSLSFAYTKGEMRQLPGIFHYRVQGELMHMLPKYTDPMPGQKPAFGQLWIIETNDAVEYRCQAPFAERCSRDMFEFLHELIANCNQYAQMYKMLYEIEAEEKEKAEAEGREPKTCKIVFKKVTDNTSDVLAFPRVNEVAAIYVCDEDGDIPWDDMHVQRKCNPGETPMSSRISKYSKHIEPLTFVLFYPYGTGDFWFYNKPKNPDNPTLGKMTALQYALSKLAYRPEDEEDNFNPLLYGGKLLSKYLVWSFMIVDNERMKYLRTHQKELRVESYSGLTDYLRNYESRNDIRIGKRVVLPSSYTQGPRNKSENFHDTMASMRKHGSPHLFLTMTSNPEHPDVINNLLPNQQPYDRPDLVDAVFNYHVKQFVEEMKQGLFGKLKSFVYVVEFQKRGLPHIHSLWTFQEGWTDIEKINRFISGELPDEEEDKELYDLVVKYMLHRPCGIYDPNAMCMQDGRCKRGFLREFCEGPQGYEDLRRDPVDESIIYATFREACVARGLVESDKMYYDALEEGSYHGGPKQLRCLYARIVAHCDVEDPLELWEKFRFKLIGDLLRSNNGNEDLAEHLAMRQVLRMIINNERSLEDYPILQRIAEIVGIDDEDIDVTAHRLRGDEMRASLNNEQGNAYEAVKEKVNNPDNSASCFYINGPGGTGKSYLFNCLFSTLIAEGKKVIVMSWSGIAASLFETGRTCHNVFKLDFPFDDEGNSGVSILDSLGKDLEKVDVIIWDEAPMAPRHAFEVVDKKLQDIMNNDIPFGGKVMVLGGDFRQLGPVVKNGTRNDVVRSSIKTSPLWEHFASNQFSLIKNERADRNSGEFAKEILKIGDGSANDSNGKVKLPEECITEEDLVQAIYQDIIEAKDYKALSSRAILSTLNSEVDAYNDKVIDLLDPETEKIYQAIDRVEAIGEGDSIQYAPEHFESFKPSGFPAYNLRLRENTVVMLMRNLSIREGLCNGTRLLVKKLERNIIVAEKLTNLKDGEDPIVMIPRITLLDESGLFQVYRKQFPIRPAFALTINKSQGQTFDKIGIDISKGIFTHGHLYVAVSRTRGWERLQIKVHEDDVNCSRNIVYTELLSDNPLDNLQAENDARSLNPDWDFNRNVEEEVEADDGDEQMRYQEIVDDNEEMDYEEYEDYSDDDDEDMQMLIRRED